MISVESESTGRCEGSGNVSRGVKVNEEVWRRRTDVGRKEVRLEEPEVKIGAVPARGLQ